MKKGLLFKARYRRAYAFLLSEFEREPIGSGDIVFLGDSLTHMGSWAAWFPDRTVRNRGISGDTSAAVLKRVGHICHDPAAVFLMIGTNDVVTNVPMAQTVDTVEAIVKAIQAQCPNAVLYVQGVLPNTAERSPVLELLNERYRAVAEAAGATFVNWWDAFADSNSAIRPEFCDEVLHLSPAGYVQWVSLLAPLVAAA
ncbi:MAG TPA: GDSL-type esterase/lipase family protein [Acidimicrobiales bacterium]|jgi:lysophospholipase L1-like esterase|nr:GDSL-type esterase/lipase family protein [Acidimicrobiales bacterium]